MPDSPADPGPTGPPLPLIAGKFQRRSPEPLGSGGMGEVFEAVDLSLRRPVALKRLFASATAAEAARLQAEALLLASVQHPHVLVIYEFVTEGRETYLVLEHMSGRCWRRELARRGQGLPWLEATRVIYQAALGLGAIHAQKIVHRDVKSANLLRTADGRVTKIADFGIARLRGHPTGLTANGAIGSVEYMSPEQWDNRDVGPPADVYGLAATYYELLTGRPPFLSGNVYELMCAHIERPFPNPRAVAREISAEVVRIITRASEKEPGNRYPTAAEFAAEVERVLTPAPPAPEPTPRVRVVMRPLEHTDFPDPSAGPARGRVAVLPPQGARETHDPDRGLVLMGSNAVARREQWRWGELLGGSEWANHVGMKFRLIPPGRADLGADPADRDGTAAAEPTRRRVAFPEPFWAAAVPVTRAVLGTFVTGAGGRFAAAAGALARHADPAHATAPDLPAVGLRYEEAALLCEWLSGAEYKYRLPTEDEWEYLARAGSCGRYWWEEAAPPAGSGGADPPFAPPRGAAVPAGRGGENAWGLYAVLGNVSEWCQSPDPTGTSPVTRGGDFSFGALTDLRLTRRVKRTAATRDERIGVRVIRELSPGERKRLAPGAGGDDD